MAQSATFQLDVNRKAVKKFRSLKNNGHIHETAVALVLKEFPESKRIFGNTGLFDTKICAH